MFSASSGGSRLVTTKKGSLECQLQVDKQLEVDQSQVFVTPVVPAMPLHGCIQANAMTLLSDIIGTNFGQGQYIMVKVKPAATLKAWCDSIRLGDVSFDRPVVVLLIDTKQVLDFQRKVVISQMIALLHAVKDRQAKGSQVIASGLLPRPINHADTGKGVSEFSHAIAAALGRWHERGKVLSSCLPNSCF